MYTIRRVGTLEFLGGTMLVRVQPRRVVRRGKVKSRSPTAGRRWTQIGGASAALSSHRTSIRIVQCCTCRFHQNNSTHPNHAQREISPNTHVKNIGTDLVYWTSLPRKYFIGIAKKMSPAAGQADAQSGCRESWQDWPQQSISCKCLHVPSSMRHGDQR